MAVDAETKVAIQAKLEARDAHLRESWVRAMETRLVRDELEKCQKSEGVNHYENCKWLADLYLDKLQDSRRAILRITEIPRTGRALPRTIEYLLDNNSLRRNVVHSERTQCTTKAKDYWIRRDLQELKGVSMPLVIASTRQ